MQAKRGIDLHSFYFDVLLHVTMPSRNQLFVLLSVFLLTGVAVLLLRQWSNRTLLAKVVIIAHDGDLLEGGSERLKERISAGEFAGVFYEKHGHGFLLPFEAGLEGNLLASLQQANADLVWYNMEPDSFFLRTWSTSYSRLLGELPPQLTDSINHTLESAEILRRQALMAKGAKRIALLNTLSVQINAGTAGMHEKLMRRYAREMLNGFSKTALRQPGKKWLFIVDVALYPYLDQAFSSTARFGHDA
jgi:hypothetical protein